MRPTPTRTWAQIAVLAVLLCPAAALAQHRVAAVASDDAGLALPAARDDSLTVEQVADMVRLAVDRIGGMAAYVPADARTVALKPNITIPRPTGSGVVTDTRVVRAVALLVHEVAPQARILIAEAPAGWIEPVHQDCALVEIRSNGGVEMVDGWEIAGHRETVADLRARGIEAEIADLNFDVIDTMRIDGFADDAYLLPRMITRADAWINVSVAKPHGSKMTSCMKNRFGILPGWIYGWGRSSGTSRHPPIKHNPQILDESLVDIYLAAPEDLCVTDLIRNTEGSAFVGAPRRSNVVVAGSDPVSADLVSGRIMGFNPDDFEFADLAYQRGRGPRFIDEVDIASDVPTVSPRFVKAGRDYSGDWAQHANYGMGPRRWTLLGPLPRDHAFTPAQIRGLRPEPGVDGWSEVVFFGHDRIDLDRYFDDPIHCAVYAYTTFTMAASDSVRFWLGSDEGLEVWLDGERIYEHEGRRQHRLGGERIPGFVEAGQHTLLVRADQGRGRFDFSLNVCEPIDDERYAGNRYPGVRYAGETTDTAADEERLAAVNRWDPGHNPEQKSVATIEGAADPQAAARDAPDSVLLTLAAPPRSLLMLEAAATAAGAAPLLADTAAMRALHGSHTWFARMPYNHDWYPEEWPDIERFLRWAGVDYSLSYGFGAGEGVRAMKGWIAQGRPVVIGFGRDWYIADGYRQTDGGLEFHYTEPDTAYWESSADYDDWWGRMPNGRWVNTPILAATPGAGPISGQALADSLAAILLHNAVVTHVDLEADWGERLRPAGLAAWDDWVIEWERLPWTRTWAMEDFHREGLNDLIDLFEYIAGNHRALGALFDHVAADAVAAGVADRRVEALRTAADGFARTADAVDSLRALLPESEAGSLTPEEEARMARIAEARAWPRRARAEVRRALTGLATLTGVELPPAAEDPLRRRDRGVRLATWTAAYHKGVCEIVVDREGARRAAIVDAQLDEPSLETHASLPTGGGWQVVVEAVHGTGLYRVARQPAADNGWSARVILDDEWVGFENPVEVVIWALPPD